MDISIKSAVLLLALVWSSALFAQSDVSDISRLPTGEFSVSPTRKELLVKPGKSGHFDLSITNKTSSGAMFYIETSDLEGSLFSDKPLNKESTGGLYSLKSYIKPEKLSVYIKEGVTYKLPFVLNLPDHIVEPNLYGLITVALDKTENLPSQTSQGTRTVSRIGIPLLVDTGIARLASGALVSFGTADGNRIFTKSSIPLKISYENTGNVYIKQSGQIEVRNIFGTIVEEIQIEPWYILPGTTRSRVITVASKLMFGPYSAEVVLVGDYVEGGPETSKVTLLVLPWQYIWILVAVFLILFRRKVTVLVYKFSPKTI